MAVSTPQKNYLRKESKPNSQSISLSKGGEFIISKGKKVQEKLSLFSLKNKTTNTFPMKQPQEQEIQGLSVALSQAGAEQNPPWLTQEVAGGKSVQVSL